MGKRESRCHFEIETGCECRNLDSELDLQRVAGAKSENVREVRRKDLEPVNCAEIFNMSFDGHRKPQLRKELDLPGFAGKSVSPGPVRNRDTVSWMASLILEMLKVLSILLCCSHEWSPSMLLVGVCSV